MTTAKKLYRFNFYPDAYIDGTKGLTAEQAGVYWMVCSLIYEAGGPIDYDPVAITRRFSKTNARRIKKVLAELVVMAKLRVVEDNVVPYHTPKLTNPRCEVELQHAERRRLNASANGQKGGRPSQSSAIPENQQLVMPKQAAGLGEEKLSYQSKNQRSIDLGETDHEEGNGSLPQTWSTGDKLERMIEAAEGNVVHDTIGIESIKPILDVIASGADFELDVLPTIAERVRELDEPLRTWGARWLRDAILARRARRLAGRGERAPLDQEGQEAEWRRKIRVWANHLVPWFDYAPDDPESGIPIEFVHKVLGELGTDLQRVRKWR